MFVSKNEDRSLGLSQKQFKYSTGLEKTKLFVKGLPFSFEKAQLEDMFKNVSFAKFLGKKVLRKSRQSKQHQYKVYSFIWILSLAK